ncbi:MAG: glycosyltransferase family 2 protein [Hymenobacteraceae bacterium]|nr:glycosyltransferase family 2 protein [Hymenobacteraceae bacterium]MDX5397694.1 glycosyltransferase family 2 protein [Hymenobacteraceae bacterium]MDX5443618.1 glycosyltransferase family 2 protein [Hymenobacteraceae bacterium]MDX5513772.1 glycosyltransferase family 2 protein [Hymenobacteraceae bacterium]
MAVINVIIPAFNEEKSIAKVLEAIPSGLVHDVIVVNNNSTDNTADAAGKAGATVLFEPQPGYGNACLCGIKYATSKTGSAVPDVLVFIDGDYADHPEEMPLLLEPILSGKADLVIGSRALGNRENGAMMPQQIFGNWLATTLLRLFYKTSFTDLGPFRAVRTDKLLQLNMQDKTYGWTVEMQLKAAKHKLKCVEVPVTYRKRIGTSKISGTVKGTVMAGYKIILTIFRYLN